MSFTFELPPSEGFFSLLDAVLRIEGRAHVAHLLVGATCSLKVSEEPLGGYLRASIEIRVPSGMVHRFTDEIRREIRRAANQIMPPTAGYRVTRIELNPSPEHRATMAGLVSQLNRLRSSRAQVQVLRGEAKELLEATCKEILRQRNPSLQVGGSVEFPWLWEEVQKALTLVPPELPEASREATRRILDKLSSLARTLAVEEADARQVGFAVWAASTLTGYLLDSHQL